jgi:curved DNA-binding protein CbpA
VDLLLRIAAGEAEAEDTAIASTGRSRDVVRQAAIFFVEQVLLSPDSDSYRILGADSHAGNAELRRNMALLVKWLHPDKDHGGQHSVFTSRVTRAWDDLKTPERRASYDESRRLTSAQRRRSKTRGKSKSAAACSTRVQVPMRRGLWRVSGAHIDESQSLLSRVWLFLLGAAK